MENKVLTVLEGKAKIKTSKYAFYNPHMKFNRDISSLAFGVAAKEVMGRNEGKISVLDGFCSSGIRGIRYWIENDCDGKITFLDASRNLKALINSNAKKNKIKSSQFEVAIEDFNIHYSKEGHDFVEIDPFGSPAQFIFTALNQYRFKKRAYLSLTATDTAVLCGTRHDACIKNYNSVPLNNDCCHENAIRILVGFAARLASQFNFKTTPLFSFSKRHYVKTILRLDFGAEGAVESAKLAANYAIFNPKSLGTVLAPAFSKVFKQREENTMASGPVWAGSIYETEFVSEMIGLNAKRKMNGWEEVERFLETIRDESGMPPYYFDTHSIFHKEKVQSVSLDGIIKNLENSGFKASRTHFSPTAIKTTAGYGNILEAIEKSRHD